MPHASAEIFPAMCSKPTISTIHNVTEAEEPTTIMQSMSTNAYTNGRNTEDSMT
jgi:hypothetical protein